MNYLMQTFKYLLHNIKRIHTYNEKFDAYFNLPKNVWQDENLEEEKYLELKHINTYFTKYVTKLIENDIDITWLQMTDIKEYYVYITFYKLLLKHRTDIIEEYWRLWPTHVISDLTDAKDIDATFNALKNKNLNIQQLMAYVHCAQRIKDISPIVDESFDYDKIIELCYCLENSFYDILDYDVKTLDSDQIHDLLEEHL